MKFRIAAIGVLLAVPALAQSPGTVNLIGPSSTPGAPKITEVGTVNAIINQALSSKFDYGPVAGVPVGGAFVTPTGGTQQTLNNALGGSALKTNNLSDLTDALTARSNLGLGSIATQSAGAVSITGGAISTADTSGATVTPTGSTVRTLANGLAGPFTLTATGTSGLYDAQVSATGGGSISGQGQLQMKAALSQTIAPDVSEQFRVMNQYSATNSVGVMGGVSGLGPVVFAYSGTEANVDLNLAAWGPSGNILMYNGDNYLAVFNDSGGLTANWPSMLTSTAGGEVVYGAAGTDAIANVQLGGNVNCSNQMIGTSLSAARPHIQGGACGSVAIGRIAVVGGSDTYAMGLAAVADGSGSLSFGNNAWNKSRIGGMYIQPVFDLNDNGKAQHQKAFFVLKATGVSGAATKRLTSDGAAVTTGLNSIKVIDNMTGECLLHVTRTDTNEQAVWKWPNIGVRMASGTLTNSTGSVLTPAVGAVADTGITGVTPTLTLDTSTSSLNFTVVTTTGGMTYNETVSCDMLEYAL